MADTAHAKTDEKLEEMEKRLSAIYSRAEKEIQQTADEYFSKFAKQDEAKRKLLEQGKITEEEYTKWRKGKVMYGKRFTEMKEQCAKQLLNVNQTALAYVNGELPEVYAINYNALESAVDGVGDYSFTLVDADTVRNFAVTDTSLLPYKEIDPAKDIPWNMKKINAETLQGILQGESMDKIAKRLRNVQEMNKTQAIRSARTIVTGAENKGRQDSYARATADGIILQKEWISTNDGRTRHSHAMLDGAIVDQDKKFDNGLMYPGDPSGRPEEVYNCFVGETKVASDSDVVRSYKHKYNGEIISIKTAGGVQFSCTPNHPILTPCGWVAAELLNNGDNILVTFGENNVFSRVNPYIKHRFPSIDAIHKFWKEFGCERACSLSVNFHGDIPATDVEVVTHKRLLRNGRNACGGNCINKFLLKLTDKTLSCFGSLFKHFWSVCKTSFGFIGCKCKSFPFFKCSVSHSCEHGFGTIANRDSVLTEYSINDLPADTVIDGELLDRLSCKVFLDTIVNVDVSVLSTHVYNLQTENGYYFVNSIVPQDAEKSNGIFAIAKNCRCTVAAVVKGFEKAKVQKAMAKQTETYSAFADGKQASQFFGERPPRSLRRENRGEYDRLREEYRQSSFGSWYEGLSIEETTSIAEYSGDAYSGINGLLRGHMTEKMVKAWDDVSSMGIREMIDHIDDSISRFELKNGIKVYRTCEKDVFESLSTQVGSKFVDDGFVSTTVLNKKVASGNVFMEIDVPPGTGRGAWINPLSGSADEEWEFLLQRGSVFEITDVSDIGDDIVVKMKWTGIEKKDIEFASREDVIAWQKRNGLYDETEEYRI